MTVSLTEIGFGFDSRQGEFDMSVRLFQSGMNSEDGFPSSRG